MDKGQDLPRQKEINGQLYTLDRNNMYRNSKGHLAPGSNLSKFKAEKRAKRDKINKATPADIRAYFRECLPEVMDVIIEQAKAGCTHSQRLILDKTAPNLKSVEIQGQNTLPTLIIQQLIKGQPMGEIIESDSNQSPPLAPPNQPETQG
jgi:hypothetical protein